MIWWRRMQSWKHKSMATWAKTSENQDISHTISSHFLTCLGSCINFQNYLNSLTLKSTAQCITLAITSNHSSTEFMTLLKMEGIYIKSKLWERRAETPYSISTKCQTIYLMTSRMRMKTLVWTEIHKQTKLPFYNNKPQKWAKFDSNRLTILIDLTRK